MGISKRFELLSTGKNLLKIAETIVAHKIKIMTVPLHGSQYKALKKQVNKGRK